MNATDSTSTSAASRLATGPSAWSSAWPSLEQTYAFTFPPDLRELLQHRLPVGGHFPNWRGPGDDLKKKMSWPVEGILFDVEQSGFWWQAWGPRPDHLDDALTAAREALEKAPKLVPVVSIRYISSEPASPNNPIFSVQQSDVLVIQPNLKGWLADGDHDDHPGKNSRRVTFWSDLIEWSQLAHLPDWTPRVPDATGEMHPPPRTP